MPLEGDSAGETAAPAEVPGGGDACDDAERIGALEAQVAELTERHARAVADLQNYRRRAEERWAERARVVIPEMDEAQKIASCEKIVSEMPGRPAITHGGCAAFYQQSLDRVTMPEAGSFESPELYYSTLFHELTHATGHAGRLNRSTLVDAVRFGDTNYSKEELVADISRWRRHRQTETSRGPNTTVADDLSGR